MSLQARFETLAASQELTPVAELDALFDALPAADEAFMLGEWTGGVFNTGHPGQHQLDSLNWAGKTFRSRDDVDPIVVWQADGSRVASPVMGSASLRQVAYRGVVTATMVYDKHPIFDHFRQAGPDAALGVMDRKGDPMPLYFYLRRF